MLITIILKIKSAESQIKLFSVEIPAAIEELIEKFKNMIDVNKFFNLYGSIKAEIENEKA